MKENILLEKTFSFAVRIVRLYQFLVKEHHEYNLSKQILRSGTSIGANAEEAMGGYSTKDFLAKLQISYKEARETRYWIRLLAATDYIDKKMADSFLSDIEELLKILAAILKSTKDSQSKI
jgi:four helix bundle protein